MPGLSDNGSYEEVDTAAIAAEIGGELFPSNDGLGKGETVNEEVAAPPLGTSSPAIPDPQQGLTAAQIKALPKSWKKDMASHWEKLPPQVHDYVYEREENVMRGLNQYGEGYNRWNALVSPYQQLLSQNPGIDPVQLMQGLMNSHLKILSAPQEERRNLAAQMLSAYGIDIGTGQQVDPNAVSPELRAALDNTRQLEQRLAQLETGWQSQQQAIYDANLKENSKKVEEFSKDAKNKYWDDVAPDILRFLKTGAATDLPSAYELACYANPAVRAKMMSEQQAGAVPTANAKAGASNFPNINGSGEGSPRRQRKGSIDDTIDAVVAKAYSQH